MSSRKLRNIRTYHFRNSRALDVARWNYHFEDGSAQDVLKTLACYQNPDGGFAYGLEPDLRTEKSNPMSTWAATRLLREIGLPSMSDRMIDGILDYLLALLGDNDRWPATIPEHNDSPVAPWYVHSEKAQFWNWNPSIELAAFILKTGRQKPELYRKAEAIVGAAMEALMDPLFKPEDHELSNFCEAGVMLMEARPELLPPDFLNRMEELIKSKVSMNIEDYSGPEYMLTPEFILDSPDSPYYPFIKDIADAWCGFLEAGAKDEGYWPIPWTWGSEPLPADAEREIRGVIIMNHMLYLQHFKPLT